MLSQCPTDHELAEALRVPEGTLAAVLDEVAAELTGWSAECAPWLQPGDPAITCTVLPSGPRSMALAFPDPQDLHRYLPNTLIPSLDVTTYSIRELLRLLLSEPSLDLIMLKPQDPADFADLAEPADFDEPVDFDEPDQPGAMLYVGLQIERARLFAAVIQRSLMEESGLGILLASFLKWLNEEHPEAESLLVAAAMARAAIEQRLVSLAELETQTGLSDDTVRSASFTASRRFTTWWTAGNVL